MTLDTLGLVSTKCQFDFLLTIEQYVLTTSFLEDVGSKTKTASNQIFVRTICFCKSRLYVKFNNSSANPIETATHSQQAGIE